MQYMKKLFDLPAGSISIPKEIDLPSKGTAALHEVLAPMIQSVLDANNAWMVSVEVRVRMDCIAPTLDELDDEIAKNEAIQ